MPQSGILKTRVFTSRGQLPVEDAAVSIVQHGEDGRQHLLNIQSSDRSGNTPAHRHRDARRLGKPVPRTGSSLFPV